MYKMTRATPGIRLRILDSFRVRERDMVRRIRI